MSNPIRTLSPFEEWVTQECVQLTPSDRFNYRDIFGPENCDQAAESLLAIAHEVATILDETHIPDTNMGIAYHTMAQNLSWALRFLDIPLKSALNYRATIRNRLV